MEPSPLSLTERLAGKAKLVRDLQRQSDGAVATVADERGSTPCSPSSTNTADKMMQLRSFFEERCGNTLAAWMRYADVDGDGKIELSEWNKAMKQMEFPGDQEALFHELDCDGSGFLTMDEIDAWSSDLWAAFRRWCAQTFTDEQDMVDKLRTGGQPKNMKDMSSRDRRKQDPNAPAAAFFTEAQFAENAFRLGWYGSFVQLLWQAMDVSGTGQVSTKDIAWYAKARGQHLKRQLVKPNKTKSGNSTPKRATVVEVRKAKTGETSVRSMQSFISFLRMRSGGCAYRGWRTILDKTGMMTVKRPELIKACIELGWRGDTTGLWQALDDADVGVAHLEDLCAREARLLALFKRWATANFGSVKAACKTIIQADRNLGARREAPKSSLDRASFTRACQKLGCKADAHAIFHLLDWERKGEINLLQIKFLDAWQSADWLSADLDPEAADAFKTQMLAKFKQHPVKAWRNGVDLDGSGMTSFQEFKQAAERLGFAGNVAGAWLCFDREGLGYITLKDIDEFSFEALREFRRWSYSHFGGVMLAFKALDSDDSGSLTLKEFKKAVKDFAYKGDVQAVWNALNVDGDATLTKWEISFLDEWELDIMAAFQAASEHAASEATGTVSATSATLIVKRGDLSSIVTDRRQGETANLGQRKGLPKAWIRGPGCSDGFAPEESHGSRFSSTLDKTVSALGSRENTSMLLKLIGLRAISTGNKDISRDFLEANAPQSARVRPANGEFLLSRPHTTSYSNELRGCESASHGDGDGWLRNRHQLLDQATGSLQVHRSVQAAGSLHRETTRDAQQLYTPRTPTRPPSYAGGVAYFARSPGSRGGVWSS